MWTIYVLQHESTGERYIGLTNDLDRRLREHNNHRQSSTNRIAGQWKLVYCEQYSDKRDAVQREQRLKHHGSAKHELWKRLAHSLGD